MQTDNSLIIRFAPVDTHTKTGHLREIALATTCTTIAGFHHGLELSAAYTDAPDLRWKAKRTRNIFISDVVVDVVVDANRTAVDESEIGPGLAECGARHIDDKIAPGVFCIANRFFGNVKSYARRTHFHIDNRIKPEQLGTPLIFQFLVTAVFGDTDIHG